VSIRFEVLKTTAGFYVWRIARGDATVYQSLEFLSAKGAAAALDQVIAAVMWALRNKSVEIHNLTGEEI
jgi:hypothetical protein